jgi:hypothetical protein
MLRKITQLNLDPPFLRHPEVLGTDPRLFTGVHRASSIFGHGISETTQMDRSDK